MIGGEYIAAVGAALLVGIAFFFIGRATRRGDAPSRAPAAAAPPPPPRSARGPAGVSPSPELAPPQTPSETQEATIPAEETPASAGDAEALAAARSEIRRLKLSRHTNWRVGAIQEGSGGLLRGLRQAGSDPDLRALERMLGLSAFCDEAARLAEALAHDEEAARRPARDIVQRALRANALLSAYGGDAKGWSDVIAGAGLLAEALRLQCEVFGERFHAPRLLVPLHSENVRPAEGARLAELLDTPPVRARLARLSAQPQHGGLIAIDVIACGRDDEAARRPAEVIAFRAEDWRGLHTGRDRGAF